jgi:hypothetical protein
LKEEFDADFSELSYEERAKLYKELQEIITKAKISDYEKKKYEVLWRQFSFRYPPKISLTPETGEKLTMRDQLARTLEVNRYEHATKGINDGFPAEEIELKKDIYIKLNDLQVYSTLKKEYEETLKIENEKERNERLHELDTEFAERIILEKDGYIQLDNPHKPNEDYKSQAIRAVKSLKKIGINVEYVQVVEK